MGYREVGLTRKLLVLRCTVFTCCSTMVIALANNKYLSCKVVVDSIGLEVGVTAALEVLMDITGEYVSCREVY